MNPDAKTLDHMCATLEAKYPRIKWDAEQWRKVLDVVLDYAVPVLRDRLTAAEAERNEAVELLREWNDDPDQPDEGGRLDRRTREFFARLRDRGT